MHEIRENIMHIDTSMSKDQSDALAWRELMRSTKNDADAIQDAWEHWRERECNNGRPNRSMRVDDEPGREQF